MKKINAFIAITLIILLATVLLIVQNYNPIDIKFFTFKFATTVGVFGILMLLSGIIIMWLISLIAHYKEIHHLKNELNNLEQQIKELNEKLKTKESQIEKSQETQK